MVYEGLGGLGAAVDGQGIDAAVDLNVEEGQGLEDVVDQDLSPVIGQVLNAVIGICLGDDLLC